MYLSTLAVRRPITTMMVFLAIVVLGMVSYKRLPVQLLPDIEFPTIVVVATNDRSAEQNLDELTRPLESTVSEMPRVRRIRSRTEANRIRIRVQFEQGVDLQYATVDLEERLISFQQGLNDPRTRIAAYPFSTSSFEATYMLLSVRGTGDLQQLFKTAGERVEQQLRSISGVANVELRGTEADVAEVEMNTDLLAAYGLDFGAVLGRVQAAASEDAFLGSLRQPNETWFVRLDDKVKTTAELADIFVDGKGVVRLRDVATIAEGSASEAWVSRADGKNAIQIVMERESGRNLIDLAKVTRTRIEEINRNLPPGVDLVIDEDFANYVEEAIGSVKKLSLQGAFLALLIPLVFFRSIRVALVVFLSVPISLIAVFNLFYAAGMSINIFSIVGLALGVGMLVDNAIVVTENAIRLFEEGASPLEAASQGGVEVGRGLFASTLTTAVVFVPIAFLDGEFKEIVREPTLALIFPLLLSLAVALTLVPVLVRGILETKKRKGRGTHAAAMHRWFGARAYSYALKGALRHRARVLFVISAAVLFTWLESCQRIQETSTQREANREWMEVYFRAPSGNRIAEVDRAARILEQRLSTHNDIRSFRVSFNAEGGQAGIRLKEMKDREDKKPFREIQQTMIDFIGDVPGIELSLRRFNDNLETAPVSLGTEGTLELKGIEPRILKAYSDALIDALRFHPSITGARIREDRTDALYLLALDRERSAVYNVQAQSLARFIGATRARGTVSALQLENGDQKTEVSFIIRKAEGATIDEVRALEVFTPSHGAVPVGELATFRKSRQETSLSRSDRQSSLELSYFFPPGTVASELTDDIKAIIATLPNPGGVITEFEGEAQRIDERQAQFIFTLLSGALLVYVVMAAVFESFWVPLIILLTNPLMLIGIVWGLDFFGLPMDDLAAFGVILLVGLAVNNGIVMMDRALEMQRMGASRVRAIFDASLTRLRPIIMTWLTTILGLLPMAVVGEEGDQWRPVAVVIIGGLTSATVLTLIVLPCFYMIGDDFVRWARPWFLRLLVICFETTEGVANAAMHPIEVIRRQRAVAPALTQLLSESIRTGWTLFLVVLRVAFALPVDLYRAIRPKTTIPAPIPEATPPGGDAFLEASNAHVIFPAEGISRLVAPLPAALRARLPFPTREVHALNSAHLSLGPGLFGLLGPNGAGKTTLLRTLAGLQEPTRGTVRLFGVAHREAPGMLAPLIGYLPQSHGIYPWMTLREYLDFFALMTAQTVSRARAIGPTNDRIAEAFASLVPLENPADRRAAVERAAAEVNLSEHLDRKVGTFSGGMRQRAGIARLLLQRPPILMVDEPTAGLDPIERVNVRVLLARLARDRAVLFSTHIVEDLENDCTRLAVMSEGRILYDGVPAELGPATGTLGWRIDAASETAARALAAELSTSGATVLSTGPVGEGWRVRYIGASRAGAQAITLTLEETLLHLIASRRKRAER